MLVLQVEQMSGEEQQLVENRPEAQEDVEAERATLNELEVSTEDELPKEEEPQGEVRTSVLVANAFRQLSSVAGRYDHYNTRNRARLVEEGEARGRTNQCEGRTPYLECQ